jgi:hypothetical protein
MTLREAILDLQSKGLPYPSAFSVFVLYTKIGNLFDQGDNFDNDFNELVEVQKTIQWYESQ